MGIEKPHRQHRHTDGDKALAYWLEQERGGDDLLGREPPLAVSSSSLPAGWWILPAVFLSVPLWALILWAIFAG